MRLDPTWRDLPWRLAPPECHEHCISCASTGCPHPDHGPDWQAGYVVTIEDPQGDYPLWLCPECYDALMRGGT